MRIRLERSLDRADGEPPRVDERGRSMLLGGEHGGAVGHLPVREGRPVLHGQHALAADVVGAAVLHVER